MCSFIIVSNFNTSYAMPFYRLKPQDLTIRSEFYTTFANSSLERKANIKLATSFINGTFLDVGEEFSFNQVVGYRTEKRGFKMAHIIANGEFVEGVGGGVCQVSTTLYNAVLLADLRVTEVHHHSLPVSYVAPSFDAMVNSGTADLKFVNSTANPMIVYATATDSQVKFTIYGEPLDKVVERESKVLERLKVDTEYLIDSCKRFPDLYAGEQKVIRWGKAGLISEGYLVYRKNGKIIARKKIRKDKYNSTKNVIVKGTMEQIDSEKIENQELSQQNVKNPLTNT